MRLTSTLLTACLIPMAACAAREGDPPPGRPRLQMPRSPLNLGEGRPGAILARNGSSIASSSLARRMSRPACTGSVSWNSSTK